MVGALSDVGNQRKINEDFLGFYEDQYKRIYIVADGMGGHKAGEIASVTAVSVTLDHIKNINDFKNPKEILKSAILSANSKILALSNTDESLAGMGTTITAALVLENTIFVANVGDSSCYVVDETAFSKVTKDHSLVQELIDEGSITEAQARSHPNKNIITRALGTSSKVEIDIFELQKAGIKKVLLCTDGLSNDLFPEEIYDHLMRTEDNSKVCFELVQMAKERGGRDNISVMIFEGV